MQQLDRATAVVKTRITTAKGTVVRELKAGDTWWSDGVAWHEVLNVGTTTGVYLSLFNIFANLLSLLMALTGEKD